MASIIDLTISSDSEDDVSDCCIVEEIDSAGISKCKKTTKKGEDKEAKKRLETPANVNEKQNSNEFGTSFRSDMESDSSKNETCLNFCKRSTDNQKEFLVQNPTKSTTPICEVSEFAGETFSVVKEKLNYPAKIDEKQPTNEYWEIVMSYIESETSKVSTNTQNPIISTKPVCEGETVAMDTDLNSFTFWQSAEEGLIEPPTAEEVKSLDALAQEVAYKKSSLEPYLAKKKAPVKSSLEPAFAHKITFKKCSLGTVSSKNAAFVHKKRGIDNVVRTNIKKKKLAVLEKTYLDWKLIKIDKDLNEDLQKFNEGNQGLGKRVIGAIMNKYKKKAVFENKSPAWKIFKKDEGFKKGEQRFIERQPLLERSDLSSFEVEKDIQSRNLEEINSYLKNYYIL